MKIPFLAIATIVVFGGAAVTLAAAENYELETKVYVFRSSSMRSIELEGSPVIEGKRPLVFGPRQSAQFDAKTLSLANGKISWNGEHNPPEGFSLVATPVAAMEVGEPVMLLSTVPIQYLERAADGSLQVRQISGDSPDAPRYQLTFTLGLGGDAQQGLPLTCDIVLAMVKGREPVAGVNLNVGKPVLARYSEKIETSVRPGEWSGFLISTVPGSDFGLLGLMKVQSPERTGGLMSAEEFYRFATYYYRSPQPELIGRAIESLGPSGLVPPDSGGEGCIGFFAEVFAANPERVPEWEKTIQRQETRMRGLFRRALKLSRPEAIAKLSDHSPEDVEIFWGAFFASGNPVYVREVAGELKQLNKGWGWRPAYVSAGLHAAMTLKSNLPEHPLVRTTLKEIQAEIDPRTRKWIDVLFAMDPAGVESELRAFVRSISIDHPEYDVSPKFHGFWRWGANSSLAPMSPSFEGTKR